jgi:hypothetical protein
MLALLMISSLMLNSCGGAARGGGGSGGGGSVVLTVTPKTVNRFPTQQQQFTVSVTGTSNTAVTWQVNGATGGGQNGPAGTIDANGLYTAPSAVPPNPVVTVSAVSQADVTKWDSAAVNIQSPTTAGTYTITITATAGTITQSTSATLVVQ